MSYLEISGRTIFGNVELISVFLMHILCKISVHLNSEFFKRIIYLAHQPPCFVDQQKINTVHSLIVTVVTMITIVSTKGFM